MELKTCLEMITINDCVSYSDTENSHACCCEELNTSRKITVNNCVFTYTF